ncbi:MAG: hypothetical protein ACPGQB_06820 [Candidatus Pseudothioglobus sp.]
MTEKKVNGILFIIAGLGSIAVYILLGDTGLLSKSHTEKIAAYTLVTIPLAFMMTRNITRNSFMDAGLLMMVVGLSMGLVSDAINSAEISAESSLMGGAIAWTGWSIMYLGFSVTGIGYLRTNLFPNWLSWFLILASSIMFVFLAITSPEQLESSVDNLIAPLWMLNSLVLVILGVFTLRRLEEN